MVTLSSWVLRQSEQRSTLRKRTFVPQRLRRNQSERDLREQVDRVLAESGASFFPRERLVIPVRRLAAVARVDPGIGIKIAARCEMRKQALGAFRDFLLAYLVLWDRCGERGYADVEWHAAAPRDRINLARGINRLRLKAKC
jgi:hypothetical protein